METYTETYTGMGAGADVGDDVTEVAQAAAVTAGNNAMFAMGGIGAGKFA